MRLVLISNSPIKAVADDLGLSFSFNEGWVGAVVSMIKTKFNDITYIFPQRKEKAVLEGNVDGIHYFGFPKTRRYDWQFEREHEDIFASIFNKIGEVDVIHIMGTEYCHTYSAVVAAEKCGLIGKVVISIQGLVSAYAKHIFADLPIKTLLTFTIRDLLTRNNLWFAQKKMEYRGRYEIKALKKVEYVIGRTDWDKACATQINPDAVYCFCNETLREEFYSGSWNYASCKKHSIFVSQGYNSIKGLHYMIEALAIIRRFYPDAVLSLTGTSPLTNSWLKRQKRRAYDNYIELLIKKHHLENAIEFCGKLSASEMKEHYLNANVFCSPSAIENSPNSVGEAMILGTPVVTSDVGGVKNLIIHDEEGFVYQHNASYMLAYYVMKLFGNDTVAKNFSSMAKKHAHITHDPNKNLSDLINIYTMISRK